MKKKKIVKMLEDTVDWEFIKHTILIVTKSFIKTNEIIEVLKQEGIFKGRKNG